MRPCSPTPSRTWYYTPWGECDDTSGSLSTSSRWVVLWVIRGFTQRPGVDYDEIFSLVVKPATVCTVLTLVVSRG
jgi:hypothetical protein